MLPGEKDARLGRVGVPRGLSGDSGWEEREPQSVLQGAPQGGWEQPACARKMFMSKADWGKRPGAGRWQATRHSHSHHYRAQRSRHTTLVIMGNGFPFGEAAQGEEAGASSLALGLAQV